MRRKFGKEWTFANYIPGFRAAPLTKAIRKEFRKRYYAYKDAARAQMEKPQVIVKLPVTGGMYLVFPDRSWRKLA